MAISKEVIAALKTIELGRYTDDEAVSFSTELHRSVVSQTLVFVQAYIVIFSKKIIGFCGSVVKKQRKATYQDKF